ncbi:MAG: sulfatase [Candidatus Eisenbacteria bacterium]|nr:sulfatase [Candidatus Eisenbacteria bacterium]
MTERRLNPASMPRTIGHATWMGLFLLGLLAVLEWIVLFIKSPVVWSGSLFTMALRNVLIYCVIGLVFGAAVGAGLVILNVLFGSRLRTMMRAEGIWVLMLSVVVCYYWVYAGNVLFPGGARDTGALAIDALALAAAVVLAAVLVRRVARAPGRASAVGTTAVVLLVLWLPFYALSSAPDRDRIEGGPNLGPVLAERDMEPQPGAPNVLMIIMDTTRTDCLGCYSDEDRGTPRIDELARSSVLFEQAITPEPLTRPAVSTILTGISPRTHGVDSNLKSLGDESLTLAEVLRQRGYVTGAVIAASVLESAFGTAQGFDAYVQPGEARWELSNLTAIKRFYVSVFNASARSFEIPAEVITDRAIEWLENNHDRPFFELVHYYDPHFPYEPPSEYDLSIEEGLDGIPVPYDDPQERFKPGFDMPAAYLEMMWLKYRGEIMYMDGQIGRLLDAVDGMGIRDDTVIIAVSDHGEGFENGFYFAHGNRLTDPLVRVVFMVSYPGRLIPARVGPQVRLADVYPSLLALLGIPLDAEVQGQDVFSGGPGTVQGDLDAFLQTDPDNPMPYSSRFSVGVRLPPWKYIESPEIDLVELYNLESDPWELTNLADSRPDVRAKLDALHKSWLATTPEKKVARENLTGRETEALRALGYIQ